MKLNHAATNTDKEFADFQTRQQTVCESRSTTRRDILLDESSYEIAYKNEYMIDKCEYVEKLDEVRTQITQESHNTIYNDCRAQSFNNASDSINRLSNVLSNLIANFQIENSMISNCFESKIVYKLSEFSGDPFK